MKKSIKVHNSSNISEISYDNSTETLIVEFHSGDEYAYYLVPERVWDLLVNSESKGKYLATEIKGNYKFSKL